MLTIPISRKQKTTTTTITLTEFEGNSIFSELQATKKDISFYSGYI